MSIIKLSSGKSSAAMISYCYMEKNHRALGPPGERCTAWTNSLALEKPEQIESAWSLTREGFGKTDGIQYHHASLSLDPSDEATAKISDKKLLRMAESFVKKHAPDHDYAIFIHRDKEHPHAHIVWNSVNHENGKKFHSSRDDLKKAIEIKDNLDRENGLKVTEISKKADIIPDKVKRLHQRDPDAYIWTEDLKSRIEAALSDSASFEDYRSRLAQDGVAAAPRGKSGAITYSFSDANGTERKCRETRLGADYARERIDQLFERNREQSPGDQEQYQSSEKSTGVRERDKRDKGTDRISPQPDTGISKDAGPESHGTENGRTRMVREISNALERNSGFEGTGLSFTDLFERHFPRDRGITISAAGAAGRHDHECAGSSAGLRKEHDNSVISVTEGAKDSDNLHRNSSLSTDSNSTDFHHEHIKSAIKELQNASSLRQYLETKRQRDAGMPADEQRRIDRNDQTHKSELVRHYCRVDYESRAAATGCERQFREATERSGADFQAEADHSGKDFKSRAIKTFRAFAGRIKEVRDAGKALLDSAKSTFSEIGSRTLELIKRYQPLREKLPEYEQSVEKYNRDAKSLEHSVAAAERESKTQAKKITVSRGRDDDFGLGM